MPIKLLVTGGTSMVGRHLQKLIPPSNDVVYLNSKNCDLRKEASVELLMESYKPEVVIHLAAKVGGIMDNINHPAEFFDDNIQINTNTLKHAYKNGCKRFIGILSSCVYPDSMGEWHYPIHEDDLHRGPPTPTNFSYGYAKRCLAVQIDAYNKQYKTDYSYLIPCNLYSEYDHFVGDKSHYVSSLIHKIAVAQKTKATSIDLFGSGEPLRQFMYANDLAHVISLYYEHGFTASYNVAPNENYSIKRIAEIALHACDAENLKINWDKSKPDGQYRKDINAVSLAEVIPHFKYTKLENGIRRTFLKYFNELAT